MRKKLKIRRYNLKNERKIGKGKIRIAFLTDLHNCMEGKGGERLMSLLEKCRPDVVLVGGDVMIGKKGKEIWTAVRFIERLSANYKVLYANGNHEQRISLYSEQYGGMGELYDREIKKTEVIRLINQKIDLEIRGIPVTVYGLDPEKKFYDKGFRKESMTGELEKKFSNPEKERYTILLSHTPRYASDYLRWGADLTLSGHYHGGVMLLGKRTGLITPDYHIFSGLCCGIRRYRQSYMIVSAGLGEHTVPFRIHNPRELTVVDVEFS